MPENPQNSDTIDNLAVRPNLIVETEAVRFARELREGLAAVAAQLAWLGEPASAAESTNSIGGKCRHFTNGITYRYTHDDGKQAWGAVPRGGVYELWTKSHWEYGPFGYPVALPEVTGNKTVCQFEGGTITSVAEKPRQVMFYNTALIGVDVAGVIADRLNGEQIYTGRGRAKQLEVLIDKVSRAKADVVVLAEMMGNRERDQLRNAVKSTFPHSAEGPDEDDPEEDGGLLILSRHPIKGEVRSTIFRSAIGVDCYANKGALMVRISPSDGPDFYVVGTHLQAGNSTSESWPLDAGVGSGAKGKREAQLRHLDSWILGVRDRNLPVIVVGDFNIDANKPAGRKTLAENLPAARDLWPEYQIWLPADTPRIDPITCPSNNASSYRAGTPRRNALLVQDGQRLDLALIDQGEGITAHVTKMGIFNYELEHGIDLSDHYAITVDLGMSTVTHKLNRKARKTTARLVGIHALTLTDGAGVPHFSKKDPDEVAVSARIYKGKPGVQGRPSARVKYNEITMSVGERHDFDYNEDKVLSFNGSDDVHLEITLEEVDTADLLLGEVEVDRSAIGRDRDVIAPKSSQLLHAYGGRRYAPNVMYKEGAEYVAILHVNVALEPFTHRRENPVP